MRATALLSSPEPRRAWIPSQQHRLHGRVRRVGACTVLTHVVLGVPWALERPQTCQLVSRGRPWTVVVLMGRDRPQTLMLPRGRGRPWTLVVLMGREWPQTSIVPWVVPWGRERPQTSIEPWVVPWDQERPRTFQMEPVGVTRPVDLSVPAEILVPENTNHTEPADTTEPVDLLVPEIASHSEPVDLSVPVEILGPENTNHSEPVDLAVPVEF